MITLHKAELSPYVAEMTAHPGGRADAPPRAYVSVWTSAQPSAGFTLLCSWVPEWTAPCRYLARAACQALDRLQESLM